MWLDVYFDLSPLALMTSFILAAKCISSLPRHYLYNFYPKWRGYTAASLISTDIIVIKMLQTSPPRKNLSCRGQLLLPTSCKFILTKSILFSDVGKKQLKFNTKSYLLTLFCYCHSFSVMWLRNTSRTQYFLVIGSDRKFCQAPCLVQSQS